jgi:hypothetical protein
MLLAVVAACGALLGFPIYFFVTDKRRRGEAVGVLGVIGVALVGLLGAVGILLLLLK